MEAIPNGAEECCAVSCLVLDFEVYQGAGTFDRFELNGKKAGQGTGAELRLTGTLTN